MKTIILWISAALHFLAATFCACAVKPDYSNQIEMMFAAFALFVGALIDAWIAISISEARKDERPRYVNGYRYGYTQPPAPRTPNPNCFYKPPMKEKRK